MYPVRIETPAGISNILLFTLGTFPEVTEEESQPYSPPNSNDGIETAEPVRDSPVVVNGTLRGPERDVFRVSGKAGERRVFEVEARRCGSAIDPVLRILDGSGKQLARSDDSAGAGLDARLDFQFPKEGNYYVEVTDARFSTQVQNFYRLKMGSYQYADGVFPLGGRRGEQVPVTFFGGHAGAGAKTTADLRSIGKQDAFTSVALPGSPALPFLFAVSDLPEVTEPVEGAVAVPGVVNGRLDKAGEVDRYRVKVEPGEKLLFELQARELGTSRLEGIITVYDASGKKLDSAGDKPLPEDVFAIQGTSRTSSDPFLNLTAPPDAHEIVVTVEDLALRGGPLYGYRLIVRRQAEDFTLSIGSPYVNLLPGGTVLISVSADRRGYDGPIQLTVPNLPKGIRAEGGIIPREYVDASNHAHVQPQRRSPADRRFGRRTPRRPISSVGRSDARRRHEASATGARPGHGRRHRRSYRTGRSRPAAPRDRAMAGPRSAGRPDGAGPGHARSAPNQSQADGRRRTLRVRLQMDRARARHSAAASRRGHRRREGYPGDRQEAERRRDVGHVRRDHHQGDRPGAIRPLCQRPAEDRRWRRSHRVAAASI